MGDKNRDGITVDWRLFTTICLMNFSFTSCIVGYMGFTLEPDNRSYKLKVKIPLQIGISSLVYIFL
jgi:hypothetical protein